MIQYPRVQDYFGNRIVPPPPSKITEDAYHDGKDLLKRLARRKPGQNTPYDFEALLVYAHDLNYLDSLQSDLMQRCLPLCLEYWQDGLREYRHDTFTEYFHAALARRNDIVSKTAGPRIASLLYEFMLNSILARMDRETELTHEGSHASPYLWMNYLSSFGTFGYPVTHLLETWGALQSIGFAVCFIQYVSLLIYEANDNPVFSRWTPEKGGGSPVLWEYTSIGSGERWNDTNIEALGKWLCIEHIEKLANASEQALSLHPQKDIVQKVAKDIGDNKEKIELRAGELCSYLATPSGYTLKWTI